MNVLHVRIIDSQRNWKRILKKTHSIFRSNAIRSKIYFPHELLQWPMEIDLYLPFSTLAHTTHTSNQLVALNSNRHRRAQWLQRFFFSYLFWLDVLCLILSTKSDERVSPKKIIFQCVCLSFASGQFIVTSYKHIHISEREICFIDLLKVGQCSFGS